MSRYAAKARSMVLIGVLLVSLLYTLSMYVAPARAQDGDYWLAGFYRRKKITITGAGSCGANYTIRIRCHNGTGSDSGDDVYLGVNHRDDFGDVRFTDSTGITEIPYHLEYTDTANNEDYTDFWVRVPDSLSSGSSAMIYLYYSFSKVHTTSNGRKTFDFFDDFNTGEFVNDTSYDPANHIWKKTGEFFDAWDIDQDTYGETTTDIYGSPDPRRSYLMFDGSGVDYMVTGGDSGSSNFTAENVRVRARYSIEDNDYNDLFLCVRYQNTSYTYFSNDDSDAYLYLGEVISSLTNHNNTAMADTASWCVGEMTAFTSGSNVLLSCSVDHYNDNTYALTYTDSSADRITTPGYVGMMHRQGSYIRQFYLDWFFAHKYDKDEPRSYTFGAEETCSDSSFLGDGSISWGYRQNFTVVSDPTQDGNATEYKVLFRIYAGSGVNLNGTYGSHRWDSLPCGVVYCNGSSNSDLSDIRFTSLDGITVLNQMRHYYNSTGGYAYFWVSIPTLNNGTSQIIYMYYGQSLATVFSESWFWSSGYADDPLGSDGNDEFFLMMNEDNSAYWSQNYLVNGNEYTQTYETMNRAGNEEFNNQKAHMVRFFHNHGTTINGTYYITSMDPSGSSTRTKRDESPLFCSQGLNKVLWADAFGPVEDSVVGVDMPSIYGSNYYGSAWFLARYDDWTVGWYANGGQARCYTHKSSGGTIKYYEGHLNIDSGGAFANNYNGIYSPRFGSFDRRIVVPEPIVNVESTTEESGGGTSYYFYFDFQDLDGGAVDPYVTWVLSNASGSISYTEGDAVLTSGSYSLETFRHGQLINTTTLITSSHGNSTTAIGLNMKYHTHRADAYITSNDTISSITIHEQTSINLTFTVSGATPCLLIIDVGGQPTNLTKDGSPVSYSYHASPARHVRTTCSSLSTFSLTWDQPPEQEEGEIPSGVSGGNPWHKKLWVTVLYHDEKLHLANVSVVNTATIWSLTDILGEAKFRVPKGQYTVRAEHTDYGSAEREVLLEDHMEIEIDIAKGSPLTVLPGFDLGELEFGVLAIPIALFVIYALSLVVRKPKRKYRYSYLR